MKRDTDSSSFNRKEMRANESGSIRNFGISFQLFSFVEFKKGKRFYFSKEMQKELTEWIKDSRHCVFFFNGKKKGTPLGLGMETFLLLLFSKAFSFANLFSKKASSFLFNKYYHGTKVKKNCILSLLVSKTYGKSSNTKNTFKCLIT